MSAVLFEALSADLTTVVPVWRLDRGDGVSLGFTAHDHDLLHDGIMHRAGHGMSVSAIVARAALDDDGITVTGPISADGVSTADLAIGCWAEARVSVDLMNWAEPAMGSVPMFRGRVTAISTHGGVAGRFVLEAQRDLALQGNRGAVRATPMCRSELGDRRCGVDLDSRTRTVQVTAIDGKRLVLAGLPDQPAEFVGGVVRFLTGAQAGFDTVIDTIDSEALVLKDMPPDLMAGTRVRIRHGCDKRFATCVARFGNAAAFDGEPHLPGRDTLVRYGAP